MKAGDLVNRPVYDLATNSLIGEIKNLLIDFADQRVRFLLLETEERPRKNGFLANLLRFSDLIVEEDHAPLLADRALMRRVTSQDVFDMLFSDVVSIFGQDFYLSGKGLGPLADFSINRETGLIESVSVRSQGTTVSIETSEDLSWLDGRVTLDPVAQKM